MYNVVYMGNMVRKQLYIEKRQQDRLSRLSSLQGVSESELIRRAIDRQLEPAGLSVGDVGAWEEAISFMRAVGERPPRRQPKLWSREALYAERLGRSGRGPD